MNAHLRFTWWNYILRSGCVCVCSLLGDMEVIGSDVVAPRGDIREVRRV